MLNAYYTYKNWLKNLKLLTFFCIEMRDVLLLITYSRGNYNNNISDFLPTPNKRDKVTEMSWWSQRRHSRKQFQTLLAEPLSLLISNTISRAVAKEKHEISQKDLTLFYWKYFEKYNEADSCDLIMNCYCGLCKHSGKPKSLNWNSLNSTFGCEQMGIIIPEDCITTTANPYYNEIRDTFGKITEDVCYDVEVEPSLHLLEGFYKSTSSHENDRLDIKRKFLYEGLDSACFPSWEAQSRLSDIDSMRCARGKACHLISVVLI